MQKTCNRRWLWPFGALTLIWPGGCRWEVYAQLERKRVFCLCLRELYRWRSYCHVLYFPIRKEIVYHERYFTAAFP